MFKTVSPLIPSKHPHNLGFILFFLAGFADGTIVPFFPLWAQHMAGIPVALIGLLFGCYAGGELLATPFIGGIADRIGRRPVLIVSAAGVGIGFISLFFTHGVVAAALVLVIIGIFESVLHPTIYTLIADVTPVTEHRRHFSKARVYGYAGGIAGPLFGAVLAQNSLSYVFLVSGSAMLCGGLVMMFFLPETLNKQEEEVEEEEEGFAALMPAFRDRRLAMLLIWTMILGITGSWIESVMPLYANMQLGLSSKDIGLLFTLGAALNCLGQMTLTKFLTLRSPFFIVIGAGITLIISFGLLLASAQIVTLVAAVCFYSLSQMMLGPLMPSAVNQLAPLRLRATYMAALSVASDLRDSVGPATGTALFAFTFTLPWIIGIPLVAIAAFGLGLSLSSNSKSSSRNP